jgi:hypothetical protein
VVVRELKTIAGQIALRPPVPGRAAAKAPGDMSAKQTAENDGLIFGLDQPGLEKPREAEPVTPPAGPAPAPWLEEATARDRVRQDAPLPEPAAKPRRNLLFSSTSRKERERAETRAADPSAAELHTGAPIAPPLKPAETPLAPLQDAWPQPERSRIADPLSQRRSNRTPSTFTETGAGAPAIEPHPAVPDDSLPPVTVLKSGVVDGMAYSLYSDGSIEAQMPEGMMRFASIDELRAHLDQRS